METIKLINLVLILPLAFTLTPPTYGQSGESLKVFAPVPANQRSQLYKRLEMLIEYERTQQWNRLFDMLPKIHNQHPEETREGFVRRVGGSNVVTLDFVPEHTITNITIDAEYMIYGCAKSRWEGRIRWFRAAVGAALENGEWYFTPITLVSGIDAPPRPCKPRLAVRR
jgi:hypothetical protein